ncbi:uncharacterized protein LOC123004174 [Tribolium madens]|uniref:uncharacterized protein LOC123004174 n=1 Tax=Tribolium madens TaxID=41895 RepID=UPI001CF76113|nr:uncharacterized protein LOC123004174 [Tribolium madens]
MRLHVYLLCVLVITPPIWGSYNVCHSAKNEILTDEECSELYFDRSEKTTSLGRVKLYFDRNLLWVTPGAKSWTNSFLRITMQNNATNRICSKLVHSSPPESYCVAFRPEMENETFLLEYKIENLPEISSRAIIFTLPMREMPFFFYVDKTETSHLILNGQKLTNNATFYEVKAFKEKNGNTNLQDLRLFAPSDQLQYDFSTYNDVGNYYFVVSVISDNCTDSVCLQVATPKIFIGRKSTRVVIGIVGASFILPFVLFLFHILTKKYPQEPQTELQERVVIAYKSSFRKHNEVVAALASLLRKLAKNQLIISVVDLSKTSKKFCLDSVLLAHRVIFVAPPKSDDNPIVIDKELAGKDLYCVLFDHTVDNLGGFVDKRKTFKMFEDFDGFMAALDISEYESGCPELRKRAQEAKIETDHELKGVPMIVVTDLEPREDDSLI